MGQDYEDQRGLRNRIRASYNSDSDEVRDWLNGNGKLVCAAIVLIFVLWIVVSAIKSVIG